MNLDNLANIGELIAATATVATLIFVAIELRASRQQNRLAMLTTLDQTWNSINAQLAQNKELSAVFSKGLYAPDSLTDDEASQFFFILVQYINNHKSVWSLLNEEGISTHHKEWLEYDVSVGYGTPGGGKVYRTMKPTLPSGFISFVEAQLEEQTLDFPDWRNIDD